MTLKKIKKAEGTVLCKTLRDESHNQVLIYLCCAGRFWDSNNICVCVFDLGCVVKPWLISSVLPQRATGKPGQVSCCCSSPGHSDCLIPK